MRARLLLAVVTILVVCAAPAHAQTGERINSYDVDIDVQRDGTLAVQERIDYDFGPVPKHGIFREIPSRFRYDDTHDRVYRIDVESVQGSAGTPDQFTVSNENSRTRIRIGDPDVTITGRHRYT